jgi:hypothetical protein
VSPSPFWLCLCLTTPFAPRPLQRGLAKLVVRQCISAIAKFEAAEAAVRELSAKINASVYTIAGVKAAYDARQKRAAATAESIRTQAETPEIRLVEALLCLELAENTGKSTIPEVLRHTGGGAVPLGKLSVPQTDSAREALKSEIVSLKRLLSSRGLINSDFSDDKRVISFHSAVLRACKTHALRIQIEELQAQLLWFDRAFTRRGADLSQTRDKSQRQKVFSREKQFELLLDVLEGWERGGFAQLPDHSSFKAQRVTARELKWGKLPWSDALPLQPWERVRGSNQREELLENRRKMEDFGCVLLLN